MTDNLLKPDGRPLKLGETGFVITSNGVTARANELPGSVTGARSGGTGFTRAVLQSAQVREMGTVILQELHPERAGDKSVSLYIPGGGREDGRLLLYFDEDGGVSFHLPQEEHRPPRGVRAESQQTLRFDIPIRPPQQKGTEGAATRGVGGMIAKKVLKVIGWKLAGIAAKKVGPPLVRQWEAAQRPLQLLPGLAGAPGHGRRFLGDGLLFWPPSVQEPRYPHWPYPFLLGRHGRGGVDERGDVKAAP